MKLQFAFGNPRRKNRRKKRVVRRKKGRHNKEKVVRKAKAALSKLSRTSMKKKRRKHSRRNPVEFSARKGGKKLGGGKFYTGAELNKHFKRPLDLAKARYDKAPEASSAKSSARKTYIKVLKKWETAVKDNEASHKDLATYQADGAKISSKTTSMKGSGVAKRKKRKTKKSAGKRKHAKRKHTKKRKHAKRKHTKRRHVKRRVAKKAHAKHSKRKHAKRRKHSKRRAKTYSHRHSSKVRHVQGGAVVHVEAKGKRRFSFKKKIGRGKYKARVSGSFRRTKSGLKGRIKINPRRRNPMANVEKHLKSYLGMDTSELGALALGGALVPVFNGIAGKIPGVSTVVGLINQYLGPQAAGSVIPIGVGALLNALAEHNIIKGTPAHYVRMAGEGMAAAGVIGLTMSLSQQYVTPALGLSGFGIMPTLNGFGNIQYTPRMGSINYTPRLNGRMGDIRYTPKMGIMPTLNGMGDGYTEAHKYSRADFGRQADFGRSADFGSSMDQDCDEPYTDDDMRDDNLGSMA
jgi:hypothetical protein